MDYARLAVNLGNAEILESSPRHLGISSFENSATANVPKAPTIISRISRVFLFLVAE
jgi:hypothetical protein